MILFVILFVFFWHSTALGMNLSEGISDEGQVCSGSDPELFGKVHPYIFPVRSNPVITNLFQIFLLQIFSSSSRLCRGRKIRPLFDFFVLEGEAEIVADALGCVTSLAAQESVLPVLQLSRCHQNTTFCFLRASWVHKQQLHQQQQLWVCAQGHSVYQNQNQTRNSLNKQGTRKKKDLWLFIIKQNQRKLHL